MTIGDSDKLRVGDPVIAIGNPLGLDSSVSMGIVSGLNRDIRETPYDDFIQTDAAINHGNSGGPLFNAQGEVVGVNAALFSPSNDSGSIGLGFAIPANDMKFVVDQLRQYGRVRPGWIGTRVQQLTPDLADALGLRQARGAIVAGVEKNSPAGKAGIREGDVVLKFGDQEPVDMRALCRMIVQGPLGQTVSLTIWRDMKAQDIPVTVAEFPADEARSGTAHNAASVTVVQPASFGLQLSPITDVDRTRYGLTTDQTGLLVTAVAESSVADDLGFVVGDVIIKIQQAAVTTPAEMQQRLQDLRTQDRRNVPMLIQGKGGQRWVALPLAATP